MDLNCLAVAALRHLSMHQELKRPVVDKAALPPVIRSLQWANDDLRCQAAALMANLSENQVGSLTSPSYMHLGFLSYRRQGGRLHKTRWLMCVWVEW